MKKWKVILFVIVLVLIIAYRKKIGAWFIAGAEQSKKAVAGAKSGAENLSAQLSDTTNKAFDTINQISQNLLNQKKYSKDLVDNAPIDQLMLNESDFLLLVKPQAQKIFVAEPKAPDINKIEVGKLKIKGSYLWWPEVMFTESPEFNYYHGNGKCDCGSCESCKPKTFAWL